MKDWHLAPTYDYGVDNLPYDRIILQLLYNRGLRSQEAVEAFFNPETSDFDPFLFRDMERVVALIIGRIKGRDKIVIFGDYDADGVTSSAIMAEALRALQAQAEIYIPDRVKEGYGLNKPALERLAADGVKLVITVDNGIRNREEVAYAKSLGLDIIVTDHHVLPDDRAQLPDCLIINPADEQDPYPWKKLCGAGVAYKLVQALVSKSTLTEEKKHSLVEGALDLAAIGTIGDLVSLQGENRLIVQRGLAMINKRGRLGLRELVANAKLGNGKDLEAWNVSWQIVPRLNAASRMEHADTAVNLLLATSLAEARELAIDLNDKNAKRQAMAEEIFLEAERLIGDKKADILIAVSPEGKIWNEGLIGLAAGKLSEKYYRPTLVITKTEEGSYKSSGRSIKEFNLIEALSACSTWLSKYGGHPMACGFSLKGEDNLESFVSAIRAYAAQALAGQDIVPKLEADMEISLEDISMDLVKELQRFEPFGQYNPKPLFVSRGLRVVGRLLMGSDSQHLKLKVASEEGRSFPALSFSASDLFKDMPVGAKIDLAYNIDTNYFNGRTEIQLKIIDAKYNG